MRSMLEPLVLVHPVSFVTPYPLHYMYMALTHRITSLDIEIQEHGRKCLEVRDNGKGIPAESYGNVASRYTTSKLTEMEDLHRLSSYGFRGEALNSLSSIAKLSCVTRTENDAAAHELVFDEQGTSLHPSHRL